MNKLEPRNLLVMRGRIWRIVRASLFIPIFYFLLQRQDTWAALVLGVALLAGWYASFQLRHQELEKPFNQLWLACVEMFLSFSVTTILIWRNMADGNSFPWLLGVGNAFFLARLVAHALYSLSVLREGKPGRPGTFWPKLSSLFVTVTIMLYVLNVQYYQEISMVATLLILGASGISYLYWYYRDADHRKPLSVASQLTMSRIVLTPVFIWVFFYDNDLVYHNNHIVFKSLALFMVVAFLVSDFLDGYLARRMGEVSTLGKYLDPFSDKISNMTVFLCFLASGYASIWMVALIYFRESSVETLRTLAAKEGMVMPARQSGKWKTGIQGTGIILILLGALLEPWASQQSTVWAAIWENLPLTVMGVVTAITLASGIDYFVAGRNILRKFV